MGNYGQVRVRLHIPLGDVVVYISDFQPHLVQIPVWTCGTMRREGERDGLLVSESDSCLVMVCTEERQAGQGNLEP